MPDTYKQRQGIRQENIGSNSDLVSDLHVGQVIYQDMIKQRTTQDSGRMDNKALYEFNYLD